MKALKKNLKKKLSFLLPTYRKIKSIIYKYLANKQYKQLNERIENYYANTNDSEICEVLDFLKTDKPQFIPYHYTKQYDYNNIVVHFDNALKLPFSNYYDENSGIHHKIFFPASYSNILIQQAVAQAMIEQHEKSPHKYLSENFNLSEGNAAVLVGASDCIFCLSIIDKFKIVYLFEADSEWADAMKATLSSYSDKICIVNKYISDENSENEITLDTFFSGKEQELSYIQADIEGAEKLLLLGAKNILTNNKKIKLSLCCYHTINQQKDLTQILFSYGLKATTSAGYMILWMQYPLKAPFLRRGVIYARY